MYTESDLEDLRKSGKIVSEIFKKIKPLVSPGVKYTYIADSIEKTIRSQNGAKPAFPPNISSNEIAAHDTGGVIDSRTLPENGIIKIDLGVTINNNLVDCARSFGLGEYNEKLITASEEALKEAIKIVKDGTRISDIGKVIQTTIEGFGFKPVRNLTGHSIEKGILHAGISIPNIANMIGLIGNKKHQIGTHNANEPFVTDGTAGYEEDAPGCPPLIYSASRLPKTPLGKNVWDEYKMIPFSARNAARFLDMKMEERYSRIIKTCDKDGWNTYPPLIEKSRGIVAQAEDTIYIGKDSAEIITYGRYETAD